ncbi:MAG: hypothetical protein IKW81_07305 [Pseudobutyrivibrio sp.]|nr:hypothetical protein [Pseudobutyrivibrio sp.]
MFKEGQSVLYIPTKEVAMVEDVNQDSSGEWYFISINNGDCFPVYAAELKALNVKSDINMKNILQMIQEDSIIQSYRNIWKMMYQNHEMPEPSPGFNLDEFSGIDDYRDYLKKEVEKWSSPARKKRVHQDRKMIDFYAKRPQGEFWGLYIPKEKPILSGVDSRKIWPSYEPDLEENDGYPPLMILDEQNTFIRYITNAEDVEVIFIDDDNIDELAFKEIIYKLFAHGIMNFNINSDRGDYLSDVVSDVCDEIDASFCSVGSDVYSIENVYYDMKYGIGNYKFLILCKKDSTRRECITYLNGKFMHPHPFILIDKIQRAYGLDYVSVETVEKKTFVGDTVDDEYITDDDGEDTYKRWLVVENVNSKEITGFLEEEILHFGIASEDNEDKFGAILAYGELLKSEKKYAELIFDKEHSGKPGDPIHMPYYSYSPTVHQLIKAIVDFKNNYPDYNLDNYREILEERNLEWKHSVLIKADVSNMDAQGLMAMFMGVICGERTCEGSIKSAIEEGAFIRWLDRLAEICDK